MSDKLLGCRSRKNPPTICILSHNTINAVVVVGVLRLGAEGKKLHLSSHRKESKLDSNAPTPLIGL